VLAVLADKAAAAAAAVTAKVAACAATSNSLWNSAHAVAAAGMFRGAFDLSKRHHSSRHNAAENLLHKPLAFNEVVSPRKSCLHLRHFRLQSPEDLLLI
jgi:hypothetical protein